jgi:hypothetical protein
MNGTVTACDHDITDTDSFQYRSHSKFAIFMKKIMTVVRLHEKMGWIRIPNSAPRY